LSSFNNFTRYDISKVKYCCSAKNGKRNWKKIHWQQTAKALGQGRQLEFCPLYCLFTDKNTTLHKPKRISCHAENKFENLKNRLNKYIFKRKIVEQ
jgi:hypothetical protein